MAWETVERNERTAALAAVRETRSLAVMKAPVGRFAVPAEFGVAAFGALFGAATNYLLIRARGIRAFQGFDPGKPGGWERMFKTIEQIAIAVWSARQLWPRTRITRSRGCSASIPAGSIWTPTRAET
jgi:hypothetical protein